MKSTLHIELPFGLFRMMRAPARAAGIAAILAAQIPGALYGQTGWQAKGTTTYAPAGSNVGIGTTNPAYPLDVMTTGAESGIRVNQVSSDIQPAWLWLHKARGTPGAQTPVVSGDIIGQVAAYGYNGNRYMYGGAVRFRATDTFSSTGGGTAIDFWTTANGTAGVAHRMIIDNKGNVGIGTWLPQYKLAVNGTVGAKEVIVTNTGWADYVLKPGYRLRPLGEIAAYVRAYQRLPDMPSEQQIRKKGVSLGDVQVKLLAKIEELTLHMIEADARNDCLERQNKQLEDRIARLEALSKQ